MKRMLLMLGLVGALGTAAAAAQTRVSVSIGFGAPAPYVSYYPRYYHQRYLIYYPRPPLIVIGRPAYRPARVIVVRRYARRHHHRW
jgi:hypothetical protein